jgi:hypothetical protein
MSVIENAAAAESTTEGVTYFDNEVIKGSRATVKDQKGRTHPYIAMRSRQAICAKCYDNAGNKREQTECQRTCFAKKCPKCSFLDITWTNAVSVTVWMGNNLKSDNC